MILSRALRAGGVLGASIALAACGAQNAPTPPTALPASAPQRVAPANDDVAYQGDVEHTGDIDAALRPPLREVWSVNLGGSRGSVGYPIVARGVVVVASDGDLWDSTRGPARRSGVKARQATTAGSGRPTTMAQSSPILSTIAVAASRVCSRLTSEPENSCGLPCHPTNVSFRCHRRPHPASFTLLPPPTAETCMRTGAENGALQWMASVENGDDSSPVVTSTGDGRLIRVSSDLRLQAEQQGQIWH